MAIVILMKLHCHELFHPLSCAISETIVFSLCTEYLYTGVPECQKSWLGQDDMVGIYSVRLSKFTGEQKGKMYRIVLGYIYFE